MKTEIKELLIHIFGLLAFMALVGIILYIAASTAKNEVKVQQNVDAVAKQSIAYDQ